jgi:hypothetical protein
MNWPLARIIISLKTHFIPISVLHFFFNLKVFFLIGVRYVVILWLTKNDRHVRASQPPNTKQ